MAQIEVHADVIQSAAKKTAESPGRETIIDHSGEVKALAVKGGSQLEKANDNMRMMAGEINTLKADVRVLEARAAEINEWIVGPRGWRLIGWAVASLLGLGIGAIVFGLASPFGWGMSISRFITTNFPAMQVFMVIRDMLLRRNGVEANVVRPAPKATV